MRRQIFPMLCLALLCAAGCARDEIVAEATSCEPGATACFDQPEWMLECQPDGARWQARRCEQGSLCHQGSCQSLVCVPESRSCQGDAVVACSADGQSRLAAEACGAGRTCEAGQCMDKVCEPNALRCAGAEVERCAASGALWERSVTCGVGSICLEGVCLSQACSEGATECGPTSLYRCTAGSWSAEPCPAGRSCVFGRCVECVGDESCEAGAQCADGLCEPIPPTLATQTLPVATAGTFYSTTVAVTGGRPDFIWSVAQGALPEGIGLAQTGELSGVALAHGEHAFRLRVVDADGLSGERDYTLEVLPVGGPVRIVTVSLPNAEHGLSYETMLQAAGGVAPYAWQVLGGTMPAGLTLGANGMLSGVPAGNGAFDFTLRVVDAMTPPGYDTRQFSLTVEIAPLEIIGERAVDLLITKVVLLPVLVPYVPYSTGLQAQGGLEPYAWSQGSAPAGLSWIIPRWGLPSGLTMAADGSVSGVVTDVSDAVRVQIPFLSFALTGYFFVGRVTDSQSPGATTTAIFCMPTVALSL